MSAESKALILHRIFGTSTGPRNGAVNLSDAGRTQICFTAGHTAVVYDIVSKRQMFLQGHCSTVSCLAVTTDKLIIVTADEGLNSLLVLWNSRTSSPLCTITTPHSFGVCAVAFSPDSHLLFTVGALNPQTNEQEVALWDVSSLINGRSDKPVTTSIVPPGDPQMAACFNINSPEEVITNGKRRVYFWMSQLPNTKKFKFYSPPLRAKDFKQRIGDYIMSTFAPGSTQALTCTMDGDVIIWEQSGLSREPGMHATDRRAVKVLHLHNTPITYLTTVGNFIVTGGADGFVRFYDTMLRIMAWFEDFNAGAILSLSFSAAAPLRPITSGHQTPILNELLTPDFIISTSQGKLISIHSAAFEDKTGQFPRAGTHLVQAMLTEISDIACHPARLAVSASNCHVAAADSKNQVLLYVYVPYKNHMRWEYVGRCQSHHGPVVGLSFGESPSGQTRMFSVDADGKLVEYDLDNSKPAHGIKIVTMQELVGGCRSKYTTMCFTPPRHYFDSNSVDTSLLLADDKYKVRVHNPDSHATNAIFLGPTYGGPMTQLQVFRWAASGIFALAYCTAHTVVGLASWPLDGNPQHSMGLVAHPSPIAGLAVSFDGRKLLTASADGVVNVWDINAGVLLGAGSTAVHTDWGVIIDDEELLAKIRDYFYYAQLKAQGVDAQEPRQIIGKVPVEMVPDLMRSVGYYPSEGEIVNLQNHIRFEQGRALTDEICWPDGVNFQEFLSLYWNHRPVTGTTVDDIMTAFKTLGADTKGDLNTRKLVEILTSAGDKLTPAELKDALQALIGVGDLQEMYPLTISINNLCEEVLGFNAEPAAQ